MKIDIYFQRFACKTILFVTYSCGMVAIYLVATMAIDRLLAIKFPIWHRNHSNRNTRNHLIFWVIVINFLMMSPGIYSHDLNEIGVCIGNCFLVYIFQKLNKKARKIFHTFAFCKTIPIQYAAAKKSAFCAQFPKKCQPMKKRKFLEGSKRLNNISIFYCICYLRIILLVLSVLLW